MNPAVDMDIVGLTFLREIANLEKVVLGTREGSGGYSGKSFLGTQFSFSKNPEKLIAGESKVM